jgi:hypothetical protein
MFVCDEWRVLHIAGERMGEPLPEWCTTTPSGKEW